MKHIKLFENFDSTKAEIKLSNSYVLIGPESKKQEAQKIVDEMEEEMASAFKETLENGGESAAMDARDDVYFDGGYKERLSELGFEMME